jgi:hypothetical protein
LKTRTKHNGGSRQECAATSDGRPVVPSLQCAREDFVKDWV